MDPNEDRIQLELSFGEAQREALRFFRQRKDATLDELVRTFPARSHEPIDEEQLRRSLRSYFILPVKLGTGDGMAVCPLDGQPPPPPREGPAASGSASLPGPGAGGDRDEFDEPFEQDLGKAPDPGEPGELDPKKEPPSGQFHEEVTDLLAVQIAYGQELKLIARYLRNDLSVLVSCEKILTEFVYEQVCTQAGRTFLLDDPPPQPPGTAGPPQGGGPGGIEAYLPLLIKAVDPKQVLVLRSLDILDKPELVQLLYQSGGESQRPQLLGFLDPSQEVKKVLSDRFAVHVPLIGLPRYIKHGGSTIHTVAQLITREERKRFAELRFESLYKNVSGLNAVQFRNAMRYIGATVQEHSEPHRIYEEIRVFKTSSSDEIEIPDTTFEDIGGYEEVKRELRRIINLMGGSIEGIDERERQSLIPRGFIFHGPPGTGKTLFAKAIANELNATIQMISGPEIMDKYVGQSESNLRRIFTTARRNAPSVIFFDEFDSLASQRSTYADGGARVNNAVVAQLLTELDGFRQDQSVLVIGTTNRVDIIDEALLRPSRLRPIQIGNPDEAARRAVTEIHACKFGVDRMIKDLCQLVLEHARDWVKSDEPPPEAFRVALFERFPSCGKRYRRDAQFAGLVQDIHGLHKMVTQAFSTAEASQQMPPAEGPVFDRLRAQLDDLGRVHGLDLENDPSRGGVFSPMQDELREMFDLLQGDAEADSLPNALLDEVYAMIAKYTEDFNNDEIRAIFQEASLEHHLEGQLITPRYLGTKIGLILRRRDERKVAHLSEGRSGE